MKPRRNLTMADPVSFRICVQGELGEDWTDYFSARSISADRDETGAVVTVIESEPVDQGAMVGLLNQLNFLGIPVISVAMVSYPVG